MSKKSRFRRPSTNDMVNGIKQCLNLNDIALTMFIAQWNSIKFEKVSLSDRESLRTVFLTHCLPIASIPFLLETI